MLERGWARLRMHTSWTRCPWQTRLGRRTIVRSWMGRMHPCSQTSSHCWSLRDSFLAGSPPRWRCGCLARLPQAGQWQRGWLRRRPPRAAGIRARRLAKSANVHWSLFHFRSASEDHTAFCLACALWPYHAIYTGICCFRDIHAGLISWEKKMTGFRFLDSTTDRSGFAWRFRCF